MAVVATPQYFEKYGMPQTPQELTKYPCIGFRLTTQGGIYAWEFAKDGLEIKIKIQDNGFLMKVIILWMLYV